MSHTPEFRRWFAFGALALLFSFQVLTLARQNSLTNDEPFEITGGYYYWTKGDVVTSRMQPPVAAALQTLPLLFHGVTRPAQFSNEDERAYRFFFLDNVGELDFLTLAPRLVNLGLGLLLGLALFFFLRRESFAFFGAVLIFWALEPNLMAHTAVAKSDLPLTLFLFLAVWAYQRALEAPAWRKALVAGLLTGVAVTTKVTALSLGLVFLALEAFHYLEIRRKTKAALLPVLLNRWGWVFVGAFVWIGLVYLPGTLCLPDHRGPHSYFLAKVLMGWKISQPGWAHYFFKGEAYDHSHLQYLPMAYLLKSPLPMLSLLFCAFALWAFRQIKLRPVEWVPPLVFFFSVLPASNMGIRLMLPCFPFLFLLAGRAAQWLWERSTSRYRKTFRAFLGALGLLWGLSLVSQFPNYLSYANEALPGAQKARLLADADLDWGQDHRRLARLAKEKGWGTVKLALFAGVDPHFYGLDWTPWTVKDLQAPQPGWVYLIDTSFLQLGPAFFPGAEAIARGWVTRIQPTGRLGDSWTYYQIPGDKPRDVSAPVPSVPSLRYYWKDGGRAPY